LSDPVISVSALTRRFGATTALAAVSLCYVSLNDGTSDFARAKTIPCIVYLGSRSASSPRP
jgi:hypothetical protein